MPDAAISRWKSPKAETRFRQLYEDACDDVARELAAGGRGRPDLAEVATRFGPTRCVEWTGSGTPLVLLHGHNGSWLSWAPLVAALPERRIVALDTVGEPGGSTQTAPIETPDDLVAWLGDVLAALDLDRPVIGGMSYGGWIAARFAAARPEALAALVLLEPAIGTVTMGRVLRQGMKVAAAQLLPRRARRWAARRIDAEPLVFDARLRRPTALAFRRFDRRIPTYAKLDDPTPDAVLAAIDVPTVLVLGGRSELHDVDAVAERARRLVRHLELHVVDGASHALPVTRPVAVAELVQAFLDR